MGHLDGKDEDGMEVGDIVGTAVPPIDEDQSLAPTNVSPTIC